MFTATRRRRFAVQAIASVSCAAAVLLSAACSSSSSTTATSSNSAVPQNSAVPRNSASSSPATSSAAQSVVQERLAVPPPYSDDAPPISNVAKVKGDKILYIPISLQIPAFQDVLAGMKSAASHVGITVTGCDANFGPTGVAACVNEALADHVSAVVMDNVPLDLMGQGASQLKAAHIAILEGEQEAEPGSDQLAYLDTGGPAMIASMADWIAVDSGGKADVLIVGQDDSPEQARYITAYLLPEFRKACPSCKTTVINVTSAQLQNLGTQVATALLQNPSINYIASEFDANVQYILQGLKNSPTGSKVKLSAAIGDLSSLQAVKSGQQAYDTLVSYRFVGWALTDQVLRMLTGMKPLESANSPWRAFDSSNIGGVSVSAASFSNDSLWGGDTYSKIFLKLWGVS